MNHFLNAEFYLETSLNFKLDLSEAHCDVLCFSKTLLTKDYSLRIQLLAKPTHGFDKFQETHQRNVIQALQIMRITPTKTL